MPARKNTTECEAAQCGKMITQQTAFRWGDKHKARNGRRSISGKRVRIYVCAERCYDERVAELYGELDVQDSGKFRDFVTFWKKSDYCTMTRAKNRGRRPVGADEIASRHQRADWWAEQLGNVEMSKLHHRDVTRCLDELRANNRTARTITVYRSELDRILSDAVYKEKVMREPAYFDLFGDGRRREGNVPVYSDRGGKKFRKALTVEEIAKLREFRRSTWEQNLAYFTANLAVNCGLREGEIAGLKWEHFLGPDRKPNLDDPQFIDCQMQNDKRGRYRTPKSDEARETKVMNAPFVSELLKEWKSYQAKIQMESYGNGYTAADWDHSFVFTRRDGKPVTADKLYDVFVTECRNSEITWLRPKGAENGDIKWVDDAPPFHWLRNTWISRLRQEFPDIPSEQILDWSGHKDPKMTFHYYDGSNYEVNADQLARMNDLDSKAV